MKPDDGLLPSRIARLVGSARRGRRTWAPRGNQPNAADARPLESCHPASGRVIARKIRSLGAATVVGSGEIEHEDELHREGFTDLGP